MTIPSAESATGEPEGVPGQRSGSDLNNPFLVRETLTSSPAVGFSRDLASAHTHHVDIYADEHHLATRVANYIADGLQAGEKVMIIARESHWNAFARRLTTRGIDLNAERDAGRVLQLDANVTLAAFMKDGLPDEASFEAVVGERVAQVTRTLAPTAKLRAFGEMVDVLWKQGSRTAALRLEELWSRLQERHAFSLLCAYAMDGFYGDPESVRDVVAAHTRVHLHTPGPRADGAIDVQTRALVDEIARRREIEVALRATLAELQEREEALRESEAQLRLVTDTLPVLVSFVDTDHRYRFVSAAYERWFGHSRDMLLGRHLRDVLGPAAYGAILPHVEAALAGTSVTFESEVPYREGGTRFIEATYIPKRSVQGSVTGFVALVADATERRAFEQLRAEESNRADRLLRVTAGIADAVSADEVYVALVDRVVEAIGAASGGLWLVDEAAGVARLARARGYLDDARRQLAEIPLDASPSLPALDCIRSDSAIWIDSQADLLSAYPHLRSLTTPDLQYKVACLPLSAQGRGLGSLALTIESEGRLTSEERGFLLLIARYASQALERLRLFESERHSRAAADAAAHRLRIMARISRAFVEAELALPARLQVVSSELAAALGGCISIALLEPDERLHYVTVHHPLPEANDVLQKLALRSPVNLGEGVTGTIASTRKSILLSPLDPDEMGVRVVPEYRQFYRRFPMYALIGAPLEVQGRVIGTVTATRVSPGLTYESEDLALLEELADRAAVAIENSRLYQETTEARGRADLLYEFAHAVGTAASLDDVYQAALDAIEAALGTPRLAILTADDEGRPRFRAWRNLSDGYRDAVDGHSPWSRDAKSFEPVLVPDALSDRALASYAQLFRRERIGSLAFFPLVMRGQLLGKFMVYFGRPHHYAPHEVEIASSIANHLASVITRFGAIARLEETIRSNELFAAVLAHDLRNPLGAIINSAQMVLMRQEGRGEWSEATDGQPLSRILRSGQRMTTMIDQLLDFTRARSGGGLSIEPHAANLEDLCEQAVAELELAQPEWSIRRETLGNAGGVWDSARILQVISNVVGNAGQHGTAGRDIVVTVDGTDAQEVRVEVRNEGAIPAALRENLFAPFFGSRRANHMGGGGLGLGLFIVREIVRAHGGEVTVRCTETQTVVSIRLPRITSRSTAAI